ncbi:MAG: radical SAM protein [Veillonellaceae bacterium]|mgnify:CR=1 FL=1|nr:radical SAM protein [Veillonellaceae bacterium]
MKHYIIPIFIPHFGCPHQCIFCNQKKITGFQTSMTPKLVAQVIKDHLARINRERRIEIAFYGGSFTALPIDIQEALLTPAYHALKADKVQAIRLSTRPDCISPEILKMLHGLGVSTIELGAQSLDDKVLQSAARGHTSQAIRTAVNLIKTAGIKCGLQLMVGLPTENWSNLIKTAFQAAELKPDFTRIYPTLVIAETHLARLYQSGAYVPLPLNEAVARSAFMKLIFNRCNIPVIRTGLQASDDLNSRDVVLAGPYHPAFGEMVDAYLFNIMVARCLDNFTELGAEVVIHHHAKDSSKVRGLANANIKAWTDNYKASFSLVPDGTTIGLLKIETNGHRCIITRNMLE